MVLTKILHKNTLIVIFFLCTLSCWIALHALTVVTQLFKRTLPACFLVEVRFVGYDRSRILVVDRTYVLPWKMLWRPGSYFQNLEDVSGYWGCPRPGEYVRTRRSFKEPGGCFCNPEVTQGPEGHLGTRRFSWILRSRLGPIGSFLDPKIVTGARWLYGNPKILP